MRISDTAALRKTLPPRRSIYDGRERLGDVEQLGNEYVARDRRGRIIGRFDTAIEAANAIGKTAAEVAP
jgi:hypothetical protein